MTDVVGDDVEIVFQKFITVCDIIMITSHGSMIQTGYVEMLQVLRLVQAVNDGFVGVGKRLVIPFSSWN